MEGRRTHSFVSVTSGKRGDPPRVHDARSIEKVGIALDEHTILYLGYDHAKAVIEEMKEILNEVANRG